MGKKAINKERAEAYQFFKLIGFEGGELSQALGFKDTTIRRNNGVLEEEFRKYKEVTRCIILSLNTPKE